jgi:hypothetical protein
MKLQAGFSLSGPERVPGRVAPAARKRSLPIRPLHNSRFSGRQQSRPERTHPAGRKNVADAGSTLESDRYPHLLWILLMKETFASRLRLSIRKQNGYPQTTPVSNGHGPDEKLDPLKSNT